MKIQDSVTKAPTPIPAPAEKLPFSSRPFAEPAAPEVTSAQPNAPHYSLRTISLAVQPKLTIGQPNDKYEQEADRVAKEVVQRINAPQSSTTRFNNPDPNTTGNGKPKLQLKPIFQRRSAIEGEATPDLESSINRARGGGQSLDPGLQRKMGQAMGADFSRVKVHTDSQSDQLNKSIQARAFTTGQDVFFQQGAYEPGSRGGQELIAHELTHVVQQNGGAVQAARRSSNVADALRQTSMVAVQRKIIMKGLENTSMDTNPAASLIKNCTIPLGYCPPKVNGTRAVPEGNLALKGVVTAPQLQVEKGHESNTAYVNKVGLSIVGYDLELPMPMQRNVEKTNYMGASIADGAIYKDVPKEKQGGDWLVEVYGSDGSYDNLHKEVLRHEMRHAEDNMQAGKDVLQPWDQKLEDMSEEQKGVTFTGGYDDALSAVYRAVGETPDDIGARFSQTCGQKSDAFHATSAGKTNILNEHDLAKKHLKVKVTLP